MVSGDEPLIFLHKLNRIDRKLSCGSGTCYSFRDVRLMRRCLSILLPVYLEVDVRSACFTGHADGADDLSGRDVLTRADAGSAQMGVDGEEDAVGRMMLDDDMQAEEGITSYVLHSAPRD